MINVTKPFLPPIEEYKELIDGVWERNFLTNQGPLCNQFEASIKKYLDVRNFLFTGNGTIALQFAIKALGLKGKIITTPFSYIATTSSILWEGCTPEFVDIDPRTLNIDSKEIARRLDKDIVGILATHVYGNPCDIDEIANLAKQAGIPVIYDGAHAFGSTYKGKSLLKYGDVSTTSFHATKIMQTIEGGGVFTENEVINERIFYMRNFGHKNFTEFSGIGINGKNSEFHAAMGIVNLKYFNDILSNRKRICDRYDDLFSGVEVSKPKVQNDGELNWSYYPIIFETENVLVKAIKVLEQNNISPRRYFYPALHQIKISKSNIPSLPLVESISPRVLCLPLYYGLETSQISQIVDLIKKSYS